MQFYPIGAEPKPTDLLTAVNEPIPVLLPVQPFEPLRNNRMIATFPAIFNIPSHFIGYCDRPSYNLFHGWQPITMVLHDPVVPSISQVMLPFIDYCREHRTPENAPVDVPPVFILTLEALDPVGTAVQRWHIYVRNLESVIWSPMDYNNEELASITIILTCLRCVLIM